MRLWGRQGPFSRNSRIKVNSAAKELNIANINAKDHPLKSPILNLLKIRSDSLRRHSFFVSYTILD